MVLHPRGLEQGWVTRRIHQGYSRTRLLLCCPGLGGQCDPSSLTGKGKQEANEAHFASALAHHQIRREPMRHTFHPQLFFVFGAGQIPRKSQTCCYAVEGVDPKQSRFAIQTFLQTGVGTLFEGKSRRDQVRHLREIQFPSRRRKRPSRDARKLRKRARGSESLERMDVSGDQLK